MVYIVGVLGLDGIPTRVLQLCDLEKDVLNIFIPHPMLIDNRNTFADKWKHSIVVSSQKKSNSSSLENHRGIVRCHDFANETNFFLLAYVTSSSRNCWKFKVVFALGGQQLNKQWPYAAYLIYTVYQNVWPPSFFSTAIRLLTPSTFVKSQ